MRLNTKLFQPKCYITTYGLKSFRYEGSQVWNEVCDLLKYCRPIAGSKAGLVKWEESSVDVQIVFYVC